MSNWYTVITSDIKVSIEIHCHTWPIIYIHAQRNKVIFDVVATKLFIVNRHFASCMQQVNYNPSSLPHFRL